MNKNLIYFKNINKNFNLLYVEDNNKVRKETIKMLKNIIPNIIEAQNGKEAIEIYKRYNIDKNLKKIDLIITDIQMPQKDGLNMIKTIRENDQLIQIIIFSAYSNSEYFQEAIKEGVDGYILKPYTIEEISEVLVSVLKKQEKKTLINICSNYYWSTTNKTLKKNDTLIKLSNKEIKLITFLLSSNQSIKSSDEIENYLFDDFETNNKRVRSLISRLNNKLESNIIESIYAQGYRIKTI